MTASDKVWSVRGITEEIRGLATSSAIKRGVTVGEYLAELIRADIAGRPMTRDEIRAEFDDLRGRIERIEQRPSPTTRPTRPSPEPVARMEGDRQSGIGGVRTPISAEVIARIEALAAEGNGRRAIRQQLEIEGVFVSESTTEKYRSAWAKGQKP